MTANPKNNLGPIALFCDFGLPYAGQMKGAILRESPDAQIIDLMVDAPNFDIHASSILLESMAGYFPVGTIFVCVVDPGVGTDARVAGVVMAGGRWFVGPLNGIFEHTIRRWPQGVAAYRIKHSTQNISASFHGRDVFAPMAARLHLSGGITQDMTEIPQEDIDSIRHTEFADDLMRVLYIDNFGNAITGIHVSEDHANNPPIITLGGRDIPWVRTFGDVSPGSPLAYANSMNLIELAVNKGRADDVLGLSVGSQVSVRCL